MSTTKDYSIYSPTELLKFSNDVKKKHDIVKENIIDNLTTLRELEESINMLISELDKTELEYIKISEEYLKRK